MVRNDHCYWRRSSKRSGVASSAGQSADMEVVGDNKSAEEKKCDPRRCVLCGVQGDSVPEVSNIQYNALILHIMLTVL